MYCTLRDREGVFQVVLLFCAVSTFSFVSVEIGIPFATSEDALSIYDCDAASRYVQLASYRDSYICMQCVAAEWNVLCSVVVGVSRLPMPVDGVSMVTCAVVFLTPVLSQME